MGLPKETYNMGLKAFGPFTDRKWVILVQSETFL
jgi:hypothetical protein